MPISEPKTTAPESLANGYLNFCKQKELKPYFFTSIKAYKNETTNNSNN